MEKINHEIETAFHEVRNAFPFGGDYFEGRSEKYIHIIKKLERNCPEGSKVLSIGAGPCDLEAMLAKLGYDVTAIDDLRDPWHLLGQNRKRILDFAKSMNIKYILLSETPPNINENCYDVVLLIDILEHLHNSPRELLNYAISLLKPNGLILIEVPNSVSLFNRLKIFVGKSNQVNIDFIYWNLGEYRSHFREYTESELKKVLSYHNLLEIESETINTNFNISDDKYLRKLMIYSYVLISGIYSTLRNTLLISARKPMNWEPTEPDINKFINFYYNFRKYNIDGDNDDLILNKIKNNTVFK